jgi:predicted NBD/HSP70 family sugar kinase
MNWSATFLGTTPLECIANSRSPRLEGVYRGRSGGAGEIGHFPIETEYGRRCVCGRDNCLEAGLGGAAMIQHLRTEGRDISTTAELVELVQRNDPYALELARAAGTAIGQTLGTLADFFNPELIVFGGRLSQLEVLTHALRWGLYARSLPLSARALTIANSHNRENASTLGAAWMIIDLLLSVDWVNNIVQLDAQP